MTAAEWRSRWARISASDTGAMDGLAVFVDHDGGVGQDVAAGAARGDGLDGVADHAGDAVLVIGTFARRAFGDGAGDAPRWGRGSLRSGARS